MRINKELVGRPTGKLCPICISGELLYESNDYYMDGALRCNDDRVGHYHDGCSSLGKRVDTTVNTVCGFCNFIAKFKI
jgi:hypothetical protein